LDAAEENRFLLESEAYPGMYTGGTRNIYCMDGNTPLLGEQACSNINA